ncbi:MAG TPA: GTP-binding protein [Chthoniobacterales bacterium]
MTAETPATSQLLSVSILAGPSARALMHDVVSRDAKCRFGLLASSHFDSQTTPDELMVEQLVAANGGGYDPGRIRVQIAAIAEKALVDHLIIECNSKTHPIAFASLFLPDGSDGQRFSEIARLSSILLAVDSETLLNSIVHGNPAPGVTSPCIFADQIECADVIVLNGEPADRDFMLARAVASALNPRGRILQRSREAIPPKLLDAGLSFDFEAAFAGAGWRKLMDEEPGARRGDKGVTMFVYRARRPFHPEKFWNLIQSHFPGVFRAKGFFWLATRMSVVGGLNIAGWECHYSPAGQWWAANAPGNHSDHPEIPDRLKKEWAEPFGDRRQAIAFMGVDVNSTDLSARLDACLLDESEMKSGERSWAMLPDPFPAWPAKTHDHECEEHDCCHH